MKKIIFTLIIFVAVPSFACPYGQVPVQGTNYCVPAQQQPYQPHMPPPNRWRGF